MSNEQVEVDDILSRLTTDVGSVGGMAWEKGVRRVIGELVRDSGVALSEAQERELAEDLGRRVDDYHRGCEFLNGDIGEDWSIVYFDDATRSWWRSTSKEVEALGRRLLEDPGPNTYPSWCRTAGRRLPMGGHMRRQPKRESPTKTRSIKVTDEDWAEIGRRAAASGETRTAYLLRRALAEDSDYRRILSDVHEQLDEVLRRSQALLR